ncbi:alpha/beta-hydrolase [Hypoxylon trugodes]|uniref:alpha/beta-hydrolase n=1 Tax=Hypoxylon trugodes TaxID=326681 RepID=UPI0021A06FA2|nr:alpha/beta-hydrolase [Hypoxylon trugodes]KAI1389329.1 alpha/beta-hydrolase [Hypoxylon trugodes]
MFLKVIWVFVALNLQFCLNETPPAPVVDLGYARYQGYYDSAYDVNIYKGIRYAAPPTGKLRWQLPQSPAQNRSQIIQATKYGSQCPQSGDGPGPQKTAPTGSEDCLFMNIFSPTNKTGLPILFWIHGGGYGQANAAFDPSPQIHTNGNSFVIVAIQYRLGAFGFLSSAEFAKSGVLNTGVHDMYFALQWVQEHIHLFGGDPTKVTIAGESAGGGSVMLLGMAYGGGANASLTAGSNNQHRDYNGTRPTEYYHRFAESAGCSEDRIKTNESVFDCLVSADTVTLQNASDYVSTTGLYGQWAFIPVTDGTLIRERPTDQLLKGGKLNGVRVLSASNSNDGPFFTPRGIENENDFTDFLTLNYPSLSKENMTNILALYSVPPNASNVLINTDGENPPYATTNSGWAYGWEQAATNLYAETTFGCPSYWLADAYAKKQGGKAWHYQFSVPPGQHGLDLDPLLQSTDTQTEGMDKVFRTAFQQIWGNFIVRGDPTLSTMQISAAKQGNITAAGTGMWPQWEGKPGSDWMLNLNMTGGQPIIETATLDGISVNVTRYVVGNDTSSQPLAADFKVAEGSSWEGGRGKRCQLWADLGPWILE